MGSISSDEALDEHSARIGSYNLSADVSESESLSSFSGRRETPSYEPSHVGDEAASSSQATSPLGWPLGRSETPSCRFPGSAALSLIGGRDVVVWEEKREKRETDISEVEMMKERFAKLLLGEDMSGGGKGVCTALAISNAITNLAATVFGELWRLEPLPPQKKSMWHREMDWLLSISDSIVELIPSLQDFPGGGTLEVMITRPRSDLSINLPALKKLDAMLLGMLDGFQDMEFWYVERGILVADVDDACPSFQRPSQSLEDKWWLPCPGIPSNGLTSDTRKRLKHSRDCVNQILKAAMAINSNVLAEMEIPDVYFETLPKSGKSCLGDIIYRYITANQFSPDCLLDCLDLSSEHHILEIVNMIEAAVHVWRQKNRKNRSHHSKVRRPSWGGRVKGLVGATERRELLAQRAESLLRTLRLRYPGLSQTALDMTKIQHNKDVGQSMLESYSRVMESLAFNILARIEDVIYVDDARKKFSASESVSMRNRCGISSFPVQKKISPSPFSVKSTPYASPFATPTHCSSTPLGGSPGRGQSSPNKGGLCGQLDGKVEKLLSSDGDRGWSYGARKDLISTPPQRN